LGGQGRNRTCLPYGVPRTLFGVVRGRAACRGTTWREGGRNGRSNLKGESLQKSSTRSRRWGKIGRKEKNEWKKGKSFAGKKRRSCSRSKPRGGVSLKVLRTMNREGRRKVTCVKDCIPRGGKNKSSTDVAVAGGRPWNENFCRLSKFWAQGKRGERGDCSCTKNEGKAVREIAEKKNTTPCVVSGNAP